MALRRKDPIANAQNLKINGAKVAWELLWKFLETIHESPKSKF